MAWTLGPTYVKTASWQLFVAKNTHSFPPTIPRDSRHYSFQNRARSWDVPGCEKFKRSVCLVGSLSAGPRRHEHRRVNISPNWSKPCTTVTHYIRAFVGRVQNAEFTFVWMVRSGHVIVCFYFDSVEFCRGLLFRAFCCRDLTHTLLLSF